jgi:UTP--glucose-1-phosphate uridylyltransferase
VSNSDNLGASPSPELAGWFARSGAPFAAEITPRTPMDVKGGHLARRRSDGRLILRESAQTTAEDMQYFTDPDIHPYASTNNLWFDLQVLRDVLRERGGVLGLPIIRNDKTVDPKDPSSPAVVQIESAMGAAIEVFEGATAIVVPRSRFLPVKTTNELVLLRSDVYEWGDDDIPRATVDSLPVVSLASTYSKIGDLDARMPSPLKLRASTALTVTGDWTFGRDISVIGDVTLGAEGGRVPDSATLT